MIALKVSGYLAWEPYIYRSESLRGNVKLFLLFIQYSNFKENNQTVGVLKFCAIRPYS